MIFLRYSHTTLQANCYILADDEERIAIVVDPGAGSHEWVQHMLDLHNLTLGAVLLTHAHSDHCWDAPHIAGDTTTVYVPAPDMYRMDDPARHTAFLADPFIAESGHTWTRPRQLSALPTELMIGGGAPLVPGVYLRALPTPGHTEGSTVYLWSGTITAHDDTPTYPETGTRQYLLAGDVLFAGSIGRTDLPGGSDTEMVESLRTLMHVIEPNTVIFPGHGPASTIAHERDNNEYVRHVMNTL